MPVPTKFDTKDIQPLDTGVPKRFDTSQIEPLSTEKPDAAPSGNEMRTDSRGGATRFLDDMETDLRHGGTRTFLGRALGKAQGRGDKGYTGLESGVSKGAADFVGSVPLGAVKMAQGIAETSDHPVKGPLKTLGGALQVATLPSAFIGGPVADAAIEAIPSRAAAAEMFKDVMADASNVPVNLSRSGNELLRMKELGDSGGTLPKAITRLLERYTKPIKGAVKGEKEGARPLTYSEARDFYSNISALSSNEKMSMNPIMKRQIGAVASALKDDIGDAAAQAGQAAKYYGAMKQYAQASRLLRAASTIGNWALKAAGAGAGIEGAKLLWNLKKDGR